MLRDYTAINAEQDGSDELVALTGQPSLDPRTQKELGTLKK